MYLYIYLPASGGEESMANEDKQLARPKAEALLLLSTQVKKVRLLVVIMMPCPKP